MTARLVRIRGKVQGVWYRSWTVEQAAQRGLRGWVRNRQDGSVEAMFAGEGNKRRDRPLPRPTGLVLPDYPGGGGSRLSRRDGWGRFADRPAG